MQPPLKMNQNRELVLQLQPQVHFREKLQGLQSTLKKLMMCLRFCRLSQMPQRSDCLPEREGPRKVRFWCHHHLKMSWKRRPKILESCQRLRKMLRAYRIRNVLHLNHVLMIRKQCIICAELFDEEWIQCNTWKIGYVRCVWIQIQQIYSITVMFVLPKTIWSLNNTVAGASHHFSKEAEIKTKFEVVFLSFLCFIVCLYLITEI